MTVTARPTAPESVADAGPVSRKRPRVRDAKDTARWPIAVLGWLGSLLLFSPIAYMLLKSFQTETDAASPSPKLLFHPTLTHYEGAFGAGFWAAPSGTGGATDTKAPRSFIAAIASTPDSP